MINIFDNNYSELIEKVKTKIGTPVSIEVVVATLESFGIKSENVPEDFRFDNSWELASSIYNQLTLNIEQPLKNQKELEKASSSNQKPNHILLSAYLFFKQYIFSTSYLLAFAIQITTIVMYGFSIYIYTGFNHVQSTVVVLGIILGMIISGGFIQVIGNQVSTHFYLQDFKLVEKMTFSLLKKGAFFILITLTSLLLLNIIFPIYPFKTIVLIVLYAFLVGLLFLVFAPLHVIKNRKVILIATAVATLTSLPFINNKLFSIHQLHFLGLSIAIITVLTFLIVYFKRKRKFSKPSEIKIQKSAVYYNNIYAFLYGLLINLFFFIDRLLAWSSNQISNFFMPIYYEKDYEIGMDISIVFFLLLAGVLEYSSTSLFNFLNENKNKTTLVELHKYKRKALRLYVKNIFIILLSSIPIYFIILYIFHGKWGYNYFFVEPLKNINIKVANIGIVGYFFLCLGLLNASYLISMKQQKKVLKILASACAINIFSGFLISRTSSYENSVYGMVIAALFFTLLTFKANITIYKNLDYYATH